MSERDDTVAKLKAQLDQWNAQIGAWESKAKASQDEMKAEYEKQLVELRTRRDAAMAQMRKVQEASADAWTEMMRGADAAWKSMADAFENARSKFDRK